MILSPPRSRALEYAGCFCCHSACSAFLAISYNGALERRDVIKPLKLLQLEFHLSGNTSRPVEGTWKKTPRRLTTARTSLDTRTKVNDSVFTYVSAFHDCVYAFQYCLVVTAATLFYCSRFLLLSIM